MKKIISIVLALGLAFSNTTTVIAKENKAQEMLLRSEKMWEQDNKFMVVGFGKNKTPQGDTTNTVWFNSLEKDYDFAIDLETLESYIIDNEIIIISETEIMEFVK